MLVEQIMEQSSCHEYKFTSNLNEQRSHLVKLYKFSLHFHMPL